MGTNLYCDGRLLIRHTGDGVGFEGSDGLSSSRGISGLLRQKLQASGEDLVTVQADSHAAVST